eukprot:5098618-Ditylum_brightwellii.AAC.1
MLSPDKEQSFEVYADADFIRNWHKGIAAEELSTTKSRSGYIMCYDGFLVIWASKLQTQVSLSTCEAEYIALSMALRDLIPIMQLLEKMKTKGFNVVSTVPMVHYKAIEDNAGAL